MIGKIVAPYVFLALPILRLAIATVLIRHGLPKLSAESLKNFSGWLGSMGFPVPMFWAAVVAILEVFGGAALILGFAVRWVALLIMVEFLVIMFFVKKGQNFGEKEIDFLIFALAFSLLLLGSGAWGLDAVWPLPFGF